MGKYDGLAWTSPYNNDVVSEAEKAQYQKVQIHDATLRDGEQTAGVVFGVDDKVEIAKMLSSLGVERIEAGMPAVSQDDRKAIEKIASLSLPSRIFSFVRAKKEDIDMVVDCGAQGVIVEVPMSVPKLKYQFPTWTEEKLINESVECVAYAKSKGLETVFFGYDTTRADQNLMFNVYDALVKNAKPDGIGVVDTTGCALPQTMAYMVRMLRNRYPDMRFEVHTHNDFGLSVASSFAAMEAGAEVIHTSINGLGERTGNTPLEQVLMGLNLLYGLDTKYDLSKLCTVSQRTSEIAKIPVARNSPVVGEYIYVRESGIGIELVQNTPLAMFATDPRISGNKAGVVLGKKSGYMSAVTLAAEMGIELTREQANEVIGEIKALGIQKKTLVTKEEFLQILQAHHFA